MPSQASGMSALNGSNNITFNCWEGGMISTKYFKITQGADVYISFIDLKFKGALRQTHKENMKSPHNFAALRMNG